MCKYECTCTPVECVWSCFYPWHLSCLPISERIITAERSNHKASYFPVSTKLNLLSEMSCAWWSVGGEVCWKCQQGQGQREEGCLKPRIDKLNDMPHFLKTSFYRFLRDIYMQHWIYEVLKRFINCHHRSPANCSSPCVNGRLKLCCWDYFCSIFPDALWFGFHLTAVCYRFYP